MRACQQQLQKKDNQSTIRYFQILCLKDVQYSDIVNIFEHVQYLRYVLICWKILTMFDIHDFIYFQYLTTIWSTCDQYLTNIWSTSYQSLINIWHIFEQYSTNIWSIFDKYLINIWQLFDNYFTNIWSIWCWANIWSLGGTPGDSHGVTK